MEQMHLMCALPAVMNKRKASVSTVYKIYEVLIDIKTRLQATAL